LRGGLARAVEGRALGDGRRHEQGLRDGIAFEHDEIERQFGRVHRDEQSQMISDNLSQVGLSLPREGQRGFEHQRGVQTQAALRINGHDGPGLRRCFQRLDREPPLPDQAEGQAVRRDAEPAIRVSMTIRAVPQGARHHRPQFHGPP